MRRLGSCGGVRRLGSRGKAKIFASAILLFAEWALEPPKKAEKAAKIHTKLEPGRRAARHSEDEDEKVILVKKPLSSPLYCRRFFAHWSMFVHLIFLKLVEVILE